jgi:chemotaxis protein MotB
MAGKGGGAWKVAYADFVTAMMAFFLVMWITSQDDEVKKAIGGYFQDPWGSSGEPTSPSLHTPTGVSGEAPFADVPTGILPNRSPQADMENATDETPGAASVWQQRQKVHLLNSADRTLPALIVNFDEASAELNAAAQQRLTTLLPALVGKRNKIEVRAHSTRRPLPAGSSFRDHWQLCYQRSLATMRFLESKGVELERMRLSQSAAYEPLTTRFESAWQDENNCVEVFLLTEIVDSLPGTGNATPAPVDAQRGQETPPAAAPSSPAPAPQNEPPAAAAPAH